RHVEAGLRGSELRGLSRHQMVLERLVPAGGQAADPGGVEATSARSIQVLPRGVPGVAASNASGASRAREGASRATSGGHRGIAVYQEIGRGTASGCSSTVAARDGSSQTWLRWASRLPKRTVRLPSEPGTRGGDQARPSGRAGG